MHFGHLRTSEVRSDKLFGINAFLPTRVGGAGDPSSLIFEVEEGGALTPHSGIDIRPLSWRKALRSIGNGECIEVASADKQVAVRDSKNPDGIWLAYPAHSWRAFVSEIKNK